MNTLSQTLSQASGSAPGPMGRFAPSPTGRMHLGNVTAALLSWLSVKSRGGVWTLRVEDLDPQRSRAEHQRQVEDDLRWLGLEWDEGGLDNRGARGPYVQSQRGAFYERALGVLAQTGLTYPCTCRRADIMATQAPHQSDGRIIYGGSCLPQRLGGTLGEEEELARQTSPHTVRLHVPDRQISFADRTYGQQRVNLARECGDFVLRRADGAWSYQLAVVVDDIAMGVTEVVRGSDLLLSSAQQIYLYSLFGAKVPEFAHVPLLCTADGRRLSKRDASLSMQAMRQAHTPGQVLGMAACAAGLRDTPGAVSLAELLDGFSWDRVSRQLTVTATN